MIWYILSIVVCLGALAGAHYVDYYNGQDLNVADLILTTVVSFIPVVNVIFTFIALFHTFSVADFLMNILNKTLVKGKKQ